MSVVHRVQKKAAWGQMPKPCNWEPASACGLLWARTVAAALCKRQQCLLVWVGRLHHVGMAWIFRYQNTSNGNDTTSLLNEFIEKKKTALHFFEF